MDARTIRTLLLFVFLSPALWQCGSGSSPSLDQRYPERVPDYITADRYTRLVIEVDYVEGMRPDAATIEQLTAGLKKLVDKPDGVGVRLDEKLAARGADYGWELGTIGALEERTFDLEVGAKTVKMHALFLDGRDARKEGAQYLGLSWANRNIVLFKQSLQQACRASAKRQLGLVERLCQQAEQMVWTHEVGHVLGLVDYGLPMVEPHNDPDHPHHDKNEDCIMYWAFERGQALDRIRGRLKDDPDADALGFDEACRADIAAMRSP